jgi:hypothetical protein
MELLGDVGHVPEAWKSFWTHWMEHLGDVSHVESRFGPFGDSVSVGARYWHGLSQTYHRLRNHFWTHPMVLLGDEAQVDVDLVHLEMLLILTQDRWTVWAKCTRGSLIILDTPDGTPR